MSECPQPISDTPMSSCAEGVQRPESQDPPAGSEDWLLRVCRMVKMAQAFRREPIARWLARSHA